MDFDQTWYILSHDQQKLNNHINIDNERGNYMAETETEIGHAGKGR
jgi:hypothetical protein